MHRRQSFGWVYVSRVVTLHVQPPVKADKVIPKQIRPPGRNDEAPRPRGAFYSLSLVPTVHRSRIREVSTVGEKPGVGPSVAVADGGGSGKTQPSRSRAANRSENRAFPHPWPRNMHEIAVRCTFQGYSARPANLTRGLRIHPSRSWYSGLRRIKAPTYQQRGTTVRPDSRA